MKHGTETAYHVRMKGVPQHTINTTCMKLYGKIDYEQLYENMLNGKSIDFDLAEDRVQLKLTKSCKIFAQEIYVRNIKRTCEKSDGDLQKYE